MSFSPQLNIRRWVRRTIEAAQEGPAPRGDYCNNSASASAFPSSSHAIPPAAPLGSVDLDFKSLQSSLRPAFSAKDLTGLAARRQCRCDSSLPPQPAADLQLTPVWRGGFNRNLSTALLSPSLSPKTPSSSVERAVTFP